MPLLDFNRDLGEMVAGATTGVRHVGRGVARLCVRANTFSLEITDFMGHLRRLTNELYEAGFLF